MEGNNVGPGIVKTNKVIEDKQEEGLLERFGAANPYIVLGVSETSSVKEIVAAYRKLILEHHPDRSKNPEAHKISQYLNRAIQKLVTKEGFLKAYKPERDTDEDQHQAYEEYDFGASNISDEDWYAGDRFWEILTEAEKGKYTDERLHNQKEAQEEREFVMSMFADSRNGLNDTHLIMTGWDDNGRHIDTEGNVSGYRDFTIVGQTITGIDKQTAIRHKKRIYNSKGEIVFDGSNPAAYKTDSYGNVILLNVKKTETGDIDDRTRQLLFGRRGIVSEERNSIEGKPEDLLLTDKQYMEHPFAKQEQSRSYVFELVRGNKKLTYFGSEHINDTQDPLFQEIKDAFNQANPQVVYVEGMPHINKNKEEIIRKKDLVTEEQAKAHGENIYTLKLALDAGIDFESPEPEFSDEIRHLLSQGFSKEAIFTYAMSRGVNQYLREHKERNEEECRDYLNPFFEGFQKDSGWGLEELENLKQRFILELNLDNAERYEAQVDPIPWKDKAQTIINDVARSSNAFRDKHIIQRISEGLKKYNKIFVVYGSAHAVKEEPALRALFD